MLKFYIDNGITIVIFNAAIKNTRIVPLLPKFVARHYPYLRDKYLGIVPSQLTIDDSIVKPTEESKHTLSL